MQFNIQFSYTDVLIGCFVPREALLCHGLIMQYLIMLYSFVIQKLEFRSPRGTRTNIISQHETLISPGESFVDGLNISNQTDQKF